jgi:vesicle-fusing ATPase
LPARNPGQDQTWFLRPERSPHDSFTFGNLLAISPQDFPLNRDGVDLYLLVNDYYVFSARPYGSVAPGTICLSEPQRLWAGVGLRDQVKVQIYHPFSQGGQPYLGSTDIEVKFAGKIRPKEPYDQDELGAAVIKVGLPFNMYYVFNPANNAIEFPKPDLCSSTIDSHGLQRRQAPAESENCPASRSGL